MHMGRYKHCLTILCTLYWRVRPVHAWCPIGRYLGTSGPWSVLYGYCLPCTNQIPVNAEYADAGPQTKDPNCPWVCRKNYFHHQTPYTSTCVPCTICTSTQYTIRGCSRNYDELCVDCTICKNGLYLKSACSLQHDTQCQPCLQCQSSQYISKPCTHTTNTECSQCVSHCPRDMYMSIPPSRCDGSTTFDIVDTGCSSCPIEQDCSNGLTYWDKTCHGNDTKEPTCTPCSDPVCDFETQFIAPCTLSKNRVCQTFKSCPEGQYASLGSNMVEVCLPCRVCADLGIGQLKPCYKARNTICDVPRCNVAGGCYQNHETEIMFCNRVNNTCGICPPGYSSSDLTCMECPSGFSCNNKGEPMCQGECAPGYTPVCDSGLGLKGYVTCILQNSKTCNKPNNSAMIITRGSFVNADPQTCYPYFVCQPGYVKYFETFMDPTCIACNTGKKPLYATWISNGLQENNPDSCLWECDPYISLWDDITQTCTLHHNPESNNKAGWVGNNTAICPMGSTSQINLAWNTSQCMECPRLPSYATWVNSILCTWECIHGEKVGEICSLQSSTCRPDTEGQRVTDGTCKDSPLPWQRPGYSKSGIGIVRFQGDINQTIPQLVSTMEYRGQNMGYFTSLGDFNMTSLGRICSMVFSTISSQDYVFLVFCNQSFISYRRIDDPFQRIYTLIGNSTSGWNEGFKTVALFGTELYIANGRTNQHLYVLDTWNCLLREITIDTPGSYSTRSSTVYGQTRKLALLNKPTCYGRNGLAYPHSFFYGIGGYLFFFDKINLYQINSQNNRVSVVLELDILQSADIQLGVTMHDWSSLVVLGNHITAMSMPCPPETTSLRGGDCNIVCPWLNTEDMPSRYVDQTNGICTPCAFPICDVGFHLVACTPVQKESCQPCLPLEPLHGIYNRTYTIHGTCSAYSVGFIPPCPRGFYADSEMCTPCPKFSTTLSDGADRVGVCVCVEGLTLINGECHPGSAGKIDALYPILEKNSCGIGQYFKDKSTRCVSCGAPACSQCQLGHYSTTNCECVPCTVPYNGVATSHGLYANVATSCAWECNIGFFPLSSTGWDEVCQLCANVVAGKTAITRGELDSPSSCMVV